MNRRGAENAEDNIFPLAGDAANGKPLIASRTLNPPKAAGSFIKSVSPDFMKNKILCVLRVSAVKMFKKNLNVPQI
jgi:hypothetical protein